MAEETAAAASSAATFTQFNGWNEDGEPVLNEAPKPAENAAESATAEEAAQNKADAEASPAGKTQETRSADSGSGKQKTEKRFQELLEKNKTLQSELEVLKSKPAAKADTKPGASEEKAAQQPQNYAEWRKDFKPAKWVEKYAADHAGSTYEEAYAAMGDYQYEVRRNFENAEQARNAALEKAGESRAKAQEIYPDFEEVAAPMADKILALVQNPQVDGVLKKAILDPEGYHILYALGKDAKIAEKFQKLATSDPAEAIYLWKTLRLDVRKELEKPAAAKADADVELPAQRKPLAPKPPSEVGGRGAVTEDTLISAAKTGDFRTFEAEQTRRALARSR